jgi:hypothetical protein
MYLNRKRLAFSQSVDPVIRVSEQRQASRTSPANGTMDRNKSLAHSKRFRQRIGGQSFASGHAVCKSKRFGQRRIEILCKLRELVSQDPQFVRRDLFHDSSRLSTAPLIR